MTLLDVEAHFLTFVECFVTIARNSGVVNEYVLAAIFWSDKAETLRRVKPLNCTSTQDNTLYIKTTIGRVTGEWVVMCSTGPLVPLVSQQ